MSLIKKSSEIKENEEKNDINKNDIINNIKHNYEFTIDNKINLITIEIVNDIIKINVCIKEIDENNNYKNINYYSKYYTYNELLTISEIFKIYNNIKDIENCFNKILSNKPLIIIEENNIKMYIKESITFSFSFNLDKIDKDNIDKYYIDKDNIDKYYIDKEPIIKNIAQTNNNKNIFKPYSIENNISFQIHNNKNNIVIDENKELKQRILALEEKYKKLKMIFEELEKEKESKIKLLENQLNKIKEKIEKDNSFLLFNEKLKKGLNGKSEPIFYFNNINKDDKNIDKAFPVLNNKNLIETKNNEIMKIFSEDEKLKSNNNTNMQNNDIKKINENNLNKKSSFFNNIHNILKNNSQNEINNQKIESDEDNNYLYSNSENEIIDDIQFFDKVNSKQNLIENMNIITPKENNNNILIGNKRKNKYDKINLYQNKKSEENSYEEIILDSKIVSFYEDYEFIIDYLRNELNLYVIKAIKIYRATENGDKAEIFHSLCDNNTNVIVLIKTKNKNKFGGFTSKGFKSNNTNIIDNSSFVFSLDNKEIYPVKKNKNAIYCCEKYGPCFTQILSIHDNFFTNTSYTFVKNLNYLTEEDYQINNGEKFFKVEELEVLELLIHD